MTQFFIETVTRAGDYNYHRARKEWVATVGSTKVNETVDQLKQQSDVVAIQVTKWLGKKEVPHHSYAVRNCSLGAKEQVIGTHYCEHDVSAKGMDGMRLYKQNWSYHPDTSMQTFFKSRLAAA